jgi:histidine triad (HIT) family protein
MESNIMNEANCIFCKIITGELPSTKVYEDDRVLALLDIGPIAKGHVLVIPKKHSEMITDTEADTLTSVMLVVKKIAQAQLTGLGADGVNITQANGAVAGQIVPHIHFHLIPRFKDDNINFNWQAQSYSDNNEMTEFAEKIVQNLLTISTAEDNLNP